MTRVLSVREIQAALKCQQREAKNRQRELERQAKEMAKLSAIEQARLEVETYENALDVLLSVHKEQEPLGQISQKVPNYPRSDTRLSSTHLILHAARLRLDASTALSYP